MSLLRSHRLTHTYLRLAGMARRNLSLSRPLGAAHDPHKEPFGSYRRPPYVVPDFTAEQLTNRVTNAPLLRLVESYRVSPCVPPPPDLPFKLLMRIGSCTAIERRCSTPWISAQDLPSQPSIRVDMASNSSLQTTFATTFAPTSCLFCQARER